MPTGGLENFSDIEELVAWMDGELPADRAAEVARRVVSEPAWRRTYQQLRAVDAALEVWSAPRPPAELAQRICRAGRRLALRQRIVRVLAPLAAAAAIVLAVWAISRAPFPQPPVAAGGVEGLIAKALRDVPKEDRFLVQNLQLVKNLPEVVSYEQVRGIVDAETLNALVSLEGQGEM